MASIMTRPNGSGQSMGKSNASALPRNSFFHGRRSRRYRRLIEAVVDYAIFQLDANGLIATWNPGAQRIKGYTQSEIIGKHLSVTRIDGESVRYWHIADIGLCVAHVCF
jgi:PAS domain-containing protein